MNDLDFEKKFLMILTVLLALSLGGAIAEISNRGRIIDKYEENSSK
jgi:hypothetical protein